MKFNKVAPFVLSAFLLSGNVVLANEPVSENEIEEVEKQPVFIQAVGTIESSEVRGEATYYFSNEEDQPFYLVITNETLVFDETGKEVELKEGDHVTAYMYADQPMLMIYPPQYNPAVVIVETDEPGFAAVGTFDENLVDAELSLKLNISEETLIVNHAGEEVADFKGGNAVVFYSVTTKSIPAQTTPTKIVVLNSNEETKEEATIETLLKLFKKVFLKYEN